MVAAAEIRGGHLASSSVARATNDRERKLYRTVSELSLCNTLSTARKLKLRKFVERRAAHRTRGGTMLPLFAFAGDLVTEPVSFEEALKANESLSLENMRALSR